MILLLRPSVIPLALTLGLFLQQGRACILSLDTMEEQELTITDYSTVREYILCPNNEYLVGSLDYNNLVQNGTGTSLCDDSVVVHSAVYVVALEAVVPHPHLYLFW
jgi:hypothetical protein